MPRFLTAGAAAYKKSHVFSSIAKLSPASHESPFVDNPRFGHTTGDRPGHTNVAAGLSVAAVLVAISVQLVSEPCSVAELSTQVAGRLFSVVWPFPSYVSTRMLAGASHWYLSGGELMV